YKKQKGKRACHRNADATGKPAQLLLFLIHPRCFPWWAISGKCLVWAISMGRVVHGATSKLKSKDPFFSGFTGTIIPEKEKKTSSFPKKIAISSEEWLSAAGRTVFCSNGSG